VLQFAPSTYYAAKSRPLSDRARHDAVLGPMLRAIWEKNYSVYGRRKLWKAAHRSSLDIGRDQVARLMAAEGICGATRAKKRFTTKADPAHVRAPDLVNRNFTAPRPDALWVADFTYCSTWSGIVYVAFIIDVFSRRLVGWKAARSMTAALVVDALNMAAWTRRHATLDGLICHTDAGSQGVFNWPSQHLDYGGGRWQRCESASGRFSCIGVRSPRRDGRLWRGVRIECGFGRQSVVGRRARTPA
jgi:putative transposase